ncbi:cytochrome c3 family protein [Candidatus Magnetaquicoccus inordinatus]|uniref:cytochrome c3 family protein n=1 Tax=Candidatus Magnetaquicoccus inordinatus TaxID=2496818 RepID=UPI00102BECF7|nr:cytochrome c3 family protein [Candidatus Magnetaquicoccus inordinatus]
MSNTRPQLGSFLGGTFSGTNGLTRYTNQGMEFAAKANDGLTGADQGEPGGNHGSWHPVLFPTGRTLAVRGGLGNTMWLAPWNRVNTDVGNLTMYCSDCHGSATANGVSAPNSGKPWGPHGSSKNFILKGDWDLNTGLNQQDDLCFKCHNYTNYATRQSIKSGFCCDKDNNLHGYHADKITSGIKCARCHAAVPHGWKNKAFLVNLNSVGAEGGQPANTKVGTAYSKFTQAPYYLDAALRIVNWKKSGSWLAADCGWSGTNNDVNWMKSTCK